MSSSAIHMDHLSASIAAGDEQALRTLIVHYTPLLGSYIFGFTKSKERTEEIVQDIFLQIWEARQTLPSIKSINGFLYVLAKHQALNAVRAAMREHKRLEKFQALQIQAEEIPEDALNLVEEAVRQLPPQQQRAWIMSRREGKKYMEIAEEMQLSRESVKKYIQWANTSITEYVLQHLEPLAVSGVLLYALSETIF